MRQFQDLRAQQLDAPGVDTGGLVILVDEGFQVFQRAIGLGAGQRRRQMIDDDRRGAPFGLRPFARIVDDEGVEMRRRAEGGFREAILRQRHRLARQPFEIAVFAEMDDRVRVERLAQPGVEGKIAVRRRQVGIMVAFGGVDVVSARRLDRDDDISKLQDRQNEVRALPERIVGRIAPSLGDRVADGGRQGLEIGVVVGGGKADSAVPKMPPVEGIGGSG